MVWPFVEELFLRIPFKLLNYGMVEDAKRVVYVSPDFKTAHIGEYVEQENILRYKTIGLRQGLSYIYIYIY